METENINNFQAILDFENLSELISVDVAFENAAKAFFKLRSSPVTTYEPPLVKYAPEQKPIEQPQVKKAPILQPLANAIRETPIKIDVSSDKKSEMPVFSSMVVSLAERGFSNLHFEEKIPDDSAAKIIKEHYQWKYPDVKVVLLTFTQDDHEMQLWKRLSEALCNLRCKSICIDALAIDHSAKWKCLFDNAFTLVLAPVKALLRIPALAAGYTFSPHTNEHRLFDIHLFPLKLGHQYLQQPDLKKELWTQLCRMLALPKSP